MNSKNKTLQRMVLAAMFLALALILPFLTGQIPQLGNALCPMHIPVLLCGFFCGPWYALTVGLVAPILRFLLFGMPPLMPTGIAMCFELAAYGFFVAILYKILPKKKTFIIVSLVGAMVIGRAIWGVVQLVLFGLGKSDFNWQIFVSGAFLNAVPGIVLQIIFIPLIVMVLQKYADRLTQK